MRWGAGAWAGRNLAAMVPAGREVVGQEIRMGQVKIPWSGSHT